MNGKPKSNESGFTIIEIIIAIIVLTVGILGLVSTAALVTRMIGRGRVSEGAAIFATQRMEQLRASACTVRQPGFEYQYRGTYPIAYNMWNWIDAGNETYRIQLQSGYRTGQNRVRYENMETTISCLR
ncbi:MAG: prepilin-type N-terminal cleavage/methylation domain-containing protein [Gemmatimonadales bacterium]